MKAKVLAITNGTGSRFYRVNPMLDHLLKLGHEAHVTEHGDRNLMQKIAWADVVVFQMAFEANLIREAKRAGKKVFVEADDLLHRAHAKHYSHKELKGLGGLKWYFRVWDCLRSADGFICTNEELKRAYGFMAKRTLVFRNWCSLPHWLKPVRKNMGEQVRILWAGSTSHTGDLAWVKPMLKNVLERNPEAKFYFVGTGGVASDDPYTQFVYGKDEFAGLPKGQYESMLPVPAIVWPYILSGTLADIAIAPLERNRFNRAKSTCKAIEYGINGFPTVASRWFYSGIVKDGETGILADTPEEWEAALEGLIRDKDRRDRMGRLARQHIIDNYDVRDHVQEWTDFVLN